jgi:hypothetical protein
MKEITYKIMLEQPWKGEFHQDVTGEMIGKQFAIRPTPYSNAYDDAKYTVDHIQTGSRIALVRTKAQARKVVRVFENAGVQWDTDDWQALKDETDQKCGHIYVDLAMDDLVCAPLEWINQRVAELKAAGWTHTCYQTGVRHQQ